MAANPNHNPNNDVIYTPEQLRAMYASLPGPDAAAVAKYQQDLANHQQRLANVPPEMRDALQQRWDQNHVPPMSAQQRQFTDDLANTGSPLRYNSESGFDRFMSTVTPIITAAGAGLAFAPALGLGATGTSIANGAISGGVGAGLQGQNIIKGALTGAIGGGLTQAISPYVAHATGLGDTASRVLTGAGVGAVKGAVTGQGAGQGALGGVISNLPIGSGVNDFLTHGLGLDSDTAKNLVTGLGGALPGILRGNVGQALGGGLGAAFGGSSGLGSGPGGLLGSVAGGLLGGSSGGHPAPHPAPQPAGGQTGAGIPTRPVIPPVASTPVTHPVTTPATPPTGLPQPPTTQPAAAPRQVTGAPIDYSKYGQGPEAMFFSS